MNKVLKIMKRLRAKDGCPWDRKQTLRSLKRCVLEEAHEVIDAIDSGKRERMQEEIGDMLCVVALLITVGEDQGLLGKGTVVNGAVRKMISRHPHVFGREKARTAGQALKFFQKVKEAERRQKKQSLFGDLGKSLPALMAADKIQRKAARVGFDWPNSAGVVTKIEEELEEIRSAVRKREKQKIREEYGDFLFSAVNFARKLGVEPETSLLEANAKFIRRFRKLETLLERQGYSLYKDKLSLKKMDFFWDQVKKKEK